MGSGVGPSLLFMPGGTGPLLLACGGGGAPLSVFMCHGVWPSSLSWWWCHCWCHIIVLHHFHVLSLHVSLLSCVPHHCHVSSPCCCPVLLPLLCPPCDVLVQCCHSSFGCHVTVSNVAPGFCVEDMIGRGEVSLLTLAHHCLWLYVGAGHCSQAMVDGHGRFWVHLCMWAPGFVCGWLASFFGQLWWQGGHGLSLASGVVLWLLLVASLVCGLWLVEEMKGCHTL